MPSEKPIEYHVEKIKEFHELKKDYPDSETIDRKLYTQLSAFEYKLNKLFFVASNEQTPWEPELLGGEIRPMLTKREFKVPQCGDYQCYYKGPGFEGWVPILVERKGGARRKSGPNDLYGTLSNKENRTNLYEEIERFKADKRFEQMYLIAECSFDEFMKYVPAFNGRERNTNHIALSAETRRATIAGIEIRGCHVIWAGTRARAIQMYKDLIRQWIMKNYPRVLGLDKLVYDDYTALARRKDRLEVELLAVNASLAQYEQGREMIEGVRV